MSSSTESSSQASAIPLGQPQRADSRFQAPAQQNSAPVIDPRETAEYKAALELEMWKEEQEELHQKMVKYIEENMKFIFEWKYFFTRR